MGELRDEIGTMPFLDPRDPENTKPLEEVIGDTMKVYINDMLVKILKAIDHIFHLEKTFRILRQHRMMLNPSSSLASW